MRGSIVPPVMEASCKCGVRYRAVAYMVHHLPPCKGCRGHLRWDVPARVSPEVPRVLPEDMGSPW